MLRQSLLYMAIVCGSLHSMYAIEIISIGGACNIARAARHNNFRHVAYPFDWLISPMASVKAAFQDDFSHILVPEEMYVRDDNKAVVDGYGFVFIHDFPTIRHSLAPEDGEIMPVHELAPDWRNSTELVKAKFDRRLQRLVEHLRNGDPIALVRYNEMTKDDAQEFIKLLKQKYPHAKLVLVVVGTTPEFQEPWQIAHVANFYIDEKDLRAWNGPAWGGVMQHIATMSPQGWANNKPIHYSYVLTAPIYSAGLFCVFNMVLGALDLYDRGEISGLSVDFEDYGYYYDPARGANWWNYYFKPIELGERESSRVKLFPTYQKIIFAYESQFEMPRERAYELIQKYIHIRPHIVKSINDFADTHFKNNFMIGVHYRGTDKSEATPVSYQDVVDRIHQAMTDHVDNRAIKIFVATDDAYFSAYIKNQFPDLVIMRDALRSDNGMGVHTRFDLAPYQKGEDAIIDCLLLSRTCVLIKMASNLSDCSLQFNPYLPVVKLNISYSE